MIKVPPRVIGEYARKLRELNLQEYEDTLKAEDMLKTYPVHSMIPLDTPLHDDENTYLDILPDNMFASPDENIDKHTLHRALEKLDWRERMVIKMHFGIDCEAVSFDEISRQLELGVSRERVRQIHMRAIHKLKKYARMLGKKQIY